MSEIKEAFRIGKNILYLMPSVTLLTDDYVIKRLTEFIRRHNLSILNTNK